MLSVIMLSVFMLSVIMLSVIMLSVIMLSVIMLSVIMLSVVMLNIVAWRRCNISTNLQCSSKKSFITSAAHIIGCKDATINLMEKRLHLL